MAQDRKGSEGEASPALAGSRLHLAFRKLGGKGAVGLDVRTEADFIKVIESGLPLSSLAELARNEGLAAEEIDRLVIPQRTLSHRKARKQPLNRTESERAIRIASITALADETFVDPGKARRWLRRPTTALAGKRPLDLLGTEPGGRTVEQLLYRIGHGIAA